MNLIDTNSMLKPKQAADINGVHHATVRRFINAGRLKAITILDTYLLDPADVRKFAKEYKRHERV